MSLDALERERYFNALAFGYGNTAYTATCAAFRCRQAASQGNIAALPILNIIILNIS